MIVNKNKLNKENKTEEGKMKTTIKIIKNYDGNVETANDNIIKIIERVMIRKYTRQYDFINKKYYWDKLKKYYYVKYNGIQYKTFYLTEVGNCISL